MPRPAFIAALTFAVGVALGRFASTDVRVEEHVREHVVVRTQLVDARVEVKAEEKHADQQRVIVRVVDRKPDGAEHSETRIEWRDRTITQTVQAAAEVRTETQFVDREAVKDRIVSPALPRWGIGLGAGIDVFKLSPVYQLSADYRLLGPVSVGGWVQLRQVDLSPTVGVGVRVAF